MSNTETAREQPGGEADLAQMVIRVTEAAQAEATICVTNTGAFAKRVHDLSDRIRVIAATTNGRTYDALAEQGLETIRLPLHAADKYNQMRYVLSLALKSAKVSLGSLVVCAMDRHVYPGEGALVVLAEVDSSLAHVVISDLLKLTDGVRPAALEAAIIVAGKIGRAARRGKRLGAIFMLGDSVEVLKGSRQLVPNPFHRHDEAMSRLTNPDLRDALVELAKLDGAFVVRGDGLIRTAGTFLTAPHDEIDLPVGLGARHAIAAAVTKRTAATAVVVSATDGNVRVFSGGKMVLQIDPGVAHDFGALEDDQEQI